LGCLINGQVNTPRKIELACASDSNLRGELHQLVSKGGKASPASPFFFFATQKQADWLEVPDAANASWG